MKSGSDRRALVVAGFGGPTGVRSPPNGRPRRAGPFRIAPAAPGPQETSTEPSSRTSVTSTRTTESSAPSAPGTISSARPSDDWKKNVSPTVATRACRFAASTDSMRWLGSGPNFGKLRSTFSSAPTGPPTTAASRQAERATPNACIGRRMMELPDDSMGWDDR